MDIEDSWEGRLWLLYYLWPFVCAMLIAELLSENNWWLLIPIIAGTGLWIYGTYAMIKRIKEVFRSKKR